MSFSFEAVPNEVDSIETAYKRFSQKPDPKQHFPWWALAAPGPAYLGCIVRIAEVKGADEVTVVPFDPYTGAEIPDALPIAVDLRDVGSVWRGPPSTIDSPTALADIDKNSFALLFFTQNWMSQNAKPVLESIKEHPDLLVKYPYAEDGLVPVINKPTPDLHDEGVDPPKSPDSFPSYAKLSGRYMNKVLIIGERPNGITPVPFPDTLTDVEIDRIAATHQSGTAYSSVVRCDGADNLLQALEVIVEHKGLIDILDILDHGAPGGILLGKEILFQCGQEDLNVSPSSNGSGTLKLLHGSKVAPKLNRFLADTAQVRLLGCDTALDESGRQLLLWLAQLIGGNRVVMGTIDRVYEKDFDPRQGFALEREILYSSMAALDGPAGDQQMRNKNLVQFAHIMSERQPRPPRRWPRLGWAQLTNWLHTSVLGATKADVK